MSVLYSSFFILINFCSIILAKQHVPVLFWSPSVDLPSVPAVKQLSSVGFREVLQDALVTSQPLIAVFLEDELSSEEFRTRSTFSKSFYDDLESAGINDNTLYLPSVVKPMDAIKDLQNSGYKKLDYNGNIPSDISKPTIVVVNLKESLKKDASSSKEILNIYNKISKAYPDMLAIYTGKHNNWSEKSIKRVRREADEPTPGELIVIKDKDFAAVANSISYIKEEGSTPQPLTNPTAVSLTNGTTDGESFLTVTFAEGVTLKFNFTGTDTWYLSGINDGDKKLVPSIQIWAPQQWSWHCAQTVEFKRSPRDTSSADTTSIIINGLQVQAFMEDEGNFGQPLDCVPYFSIAIWTGIVVVILMLAILSWGLVMLMDINNNDRFDDPKGKTITISATD